MLLGLVILGSYWSGGWAVLVELSPMILGGSCWWGGPVGLVVLLAWDWGVQFRPGGFLGWTWRVGRYSGKVG